MKIPRKIYVLSIALMAIPSSVYAQSGGSLLPPVGVPSTVMKTLDEVEARTAISTLPYTISVSGSYYLTRNLFSAADGVMILASDVSLDLNGFSLSGGNADSGTEGVKVEGAAGASVDNISIYNGVIRGFGNAVEFSYVENSVIKNLRCSNSGSVTLEISNSHGNTVTQVKVRSSAGDALLVTDGDDNLIKENHFVEGAANGDYKGINIASGKYNLIIQNVCSNYKDNFQFNGDAVYGPEAKKKGKLDDKKDSGHPWANFSLDED